VKALLKKDSSTASKPDAGTRIWTSEHGWTPLMYCAKSRVGATDKKKAAVLAEIAHLLIASGASPDGCVDMAMENLAVLRAMLDAGGKVADDDSIHHAACEGHHDALDILLEYGTSLRGTLGTDHHCGYTPFGCAITSRSMQGVQWFLDHGQDSNQIGSKTGENGLHVAVHYGASDKLLALLLEGGCKLNQKDKEKHTPLDRAKEKKHKKAIAALEAAGAS
jgi:ankyrin repeat protein